MSGNDCGPEHLRCRLEEAIGFDGYRFSSCPNHLELCLNTVLQLLNESNRNLCSIESILSRQLNDLLSTPQAGGPKEKT